MFEIETTRVHVEVHDALNNDYIYVSFQPLLFQVDADSAGRVFYAALVGIKGDWPWLRKCMCLATGFRSKRICHFCPGDVA